MPETCWRSILCMAFLNPTSPYRMKCKYLPPRLSTCAKKQTYLPHREVQSFWPRFVHGLKRVNATIDVVPGISLIKSLEFLGSEHYRLRMNMEISWRSMEMQGSNTLNGVQIWPWPKILVNHGSCASKATLQSLWFCISAPNSI